MLVCIQGEHCKGVVLCSKTSPRRDSPDKTRSRAWKKVIHQLCINYASIIHQLYINYTLIIHKLYIYYTYIIYKLYIYYI